MKPSTVKGIGYGFLFVFLYWLTFNVSYGFIPIFLLYLGLIVYLIFKKFAK